MYELTKIILPDQSTIGPFSAESCSSRTEALCEINYPTHSMRVIPFSVANGDRSPIGFETIKISLATAPEHKALPLQIKSADSSSLNVIALVVGVSVGFIVLTACVVLLVYCCFLTAHHNSGDRDLRNAPKDGSKPFSIMFTDIQRSTSLWAELPELMGEAIDAHHSIIRELIKKHNGYEVKTIGDAFMIAFCSAKDAVLLSKELQENFFKYDFKGVQEIDRCLREFEMQMIAEQDDDADVTAFAALSCYLNEEQYNKSWRGIRVRVGIHTAMGDIKLDPVTHAYDYYGTISNVSARVEAAAHGGQVVCTEATRKAYLDAILSAESKTAKSGNNGANGAGVNAGGSSEVKVHIPAQGALPSRFADDFDDDEGVEIASPVIVVVPPLNSKNPSVNSGAVTGANASANTPSQPPTNIVQFTDLGYNVLRGVPDPMWLHQIETVPGRKFGPLRVEVPPVNQEDSEADDASSSQAESIGKQIAKELQRLTDLTVAILRTAFSPIPAKKRVTDFKALCKTWRVKGKTIENFKKRFLKEQTEDEAKFLHGVTRSNGAAATPLGNESGGVPASASSHPQLNNNNKPESVASNNQQRFKNFGGVSNAGTVKTFNVNAKAKIIEEEAYIQSVAPLVAAVAIKKLPRQQLMLLVGDGGSRGYNGTSEQMSMRKRFGNGGTSPKQSTFEVIANNSFAKPSHFQQINASIGVELDPTTHHSQNYQFNSIFTNNESMSLLPGQTNPGLVGDESTDIAKIHNLRANYPRGASLSNNKALLLGGANVGGSTRSSPLLPLPAPDANNTQSSNGLPDQFSSVDELERISASIKGGSKNNNAVNYGDPLTMPKGFYTHLEFLKKETDQWNQLATAASSYPDQRIPDEVVERKNNAIKALTTNKYKDERQKLLEAHGLVSGYSHLPPPSTEDEALVKLRTLMSTQYPEWYNRDGNHGKNAPPPPDTTPDFVANIERVLRETIGTKEFATAIADTLSPTSAQRGSTFPSSTEVGGLPGAVSASTTPASSPALRTTNAAPPVSIAPKRPSITATYADTGTGSIIAPTLNTARAPSSTILSPPTPKDERSKMLQEHGMVSGYGHLPPPVASDDEARERLKVLMAEQFPTLYSRKEATNQHLGVGGSSENGPTSALASTSGVQLGNHQTNAVAMHHPNAPTAVSPTIIPTNGMCTPLQGSSASELVALNISPVPHAGPHNTGTNTSPAAAAAAVGPKKKPTAVFDHGLMDNMVLPPPTSSEEEAARVLKAMFYGNGNIPTLTVQHAPYGGTTNNSVQFGTPSTTNTNSSEDALRNTAESKDSRGPAFGRKSTMAPPDHNHPADPSLVFAKFKNSITSDRTPMSTPDPFQPTIVSPGGVGVPLSPITTAVISSSSVAEASHAPVSVLGLSNTMGHVGVLAGTVGPTYSSTLESTDQINVVETITGGSINRKPKGHQIPPLPHNNSKPFTVTNTTTNGERQNKSAVSSPTSALTVSAKFPSADHIAAPGGQQPNGKVFGRVTSMDTLAPSKAGAITRAPSEMSQQGNTPLVMNTSDSLSSKAPGSHDGNTIQS